MASCRTPDPSETRLEKFLLDADVACKRAIASVPAEIAEAGVLASERAAYFVTTYKLTHNQRPLSTAGSTGQCNSASLSAGEANPNVSLGRWLSRNAILFRYD